MDREELYSLFIEDLTHRTDWEEKQRSWYQMRHNGPGRASPPWPGAANLHLPLSDTIIGKFKPFYDNQVYGFDLIADFTPLDDKIQDASTMAAYWFNDKMRRKTNLKKQILVNVDKMLQNGVSFLKIKWCEKKQQIEFDAIETMDLILPSHTTCLQDADRVAHVIRMSETAYRRNKLYNQDDSFIQSIKGGLDDSDKVRLEEAKLKRQGFTYTANKDQIIIWETFQKEEYTDENGNKKEGWIVDTYSPQNLAEAVRDPFILPYNHGQIPIVENLCEVKDQAIYSSRGIPESVAMEEAYGTKLMNEKADAMTLMNRPMFTAPGSIVNVENFQFGPGTIAPFELKPMIMPEPPISFDTEINNVRQMAEQRAGTPDFGISYSNKPMTEQKTATEVKEISGLNQINVGLKSSMFRDFLTQVYEQCWSLYCQYASDDLEYFVNSQFDEVAPEIFTTKFRIEPRASVDGQNRQFLQQKAQQRFQMFNGSPYVQQGELTRSVLELDDPRLIERLYIEPQQADLDQAEDQASEILLLKEGFPAQVKQTDNHKVHLDTMIGYIQQLTQAGISITGTAQQALLQHYVQHLESIKTVDSKLYNHYKQILEQIYASQNHGMGQPQQPSQMQPMQAT
jgi:hypothetical protein